MEFVPDERSLILGLDPDKMETRASSWPTTASTPERVAHKLHVARRLYVHSYLVYDFAPLAVIQSLQAVEACLRWAFDASEKVSLKSLVDRAMAGGALSALSSHQMDAGRQLRNMLIQSAAIDVWTPAMAAGPLESSHRIVAELVTWRETTPVVEIRLDPPAS